MLSYENEALIILMVIAATCSLLGSFVYLRRLSMITDGISHSVLPGIVVAYLITDQLNSLTHFSLAVVAGVLFYYLTEFLQKARTISSSTAIGLAFPALFSIGVLLIGVYAKNVHLDYDVVISGNLILEVFDRIGTDGLMPRILPLTIANLLIAAVFVGLFYKELKLTNFDPLLSVSMGFSPSLIRMVLLVLVSLTAVMSFKIAGSILVLGLMIIPPATARLLCSKMAPMLGMSLVLSLLLSFTGFRLSVYFDLSIPGSVVAVMGFGYFCAYCFSPRDGLIRRILKLKEERIRTNIGLLAVHISQHRNTLLEEQENSSRQMFIHMGWHKERTRIAMREAVNRGYIVEENGVMHLTKEGLALAKTLTEW